MKSPSPPPAPDPVATASAQSGANRDTAVTQGILNMTNQVGPDGSLTYSKIGDETLTDSLTGKQYSVPRYQATTTLSESGQKLQGLNERLTQNLAQIGVDQSSKIGSLLGTNLSFDGIASAMDPNAVKVGNYKDVGSNDYSADRQKYEDALLARINPQLDRDRASLETKLSNQGIIAGSQAWNDAIDSANRASTDARYGAILAGGTEQSRMADLERANVGFNNANEQQRVAESAALFGRSQQARQQGISEATTLRNQPLNEISALLSGSQVAQPTFVNTPQTQLGGTDYQGAVYQSYAGQMDAYKQKVASQNAMMGGLFGLAGTIGKAFVSTPSDRRLKTDIQRVGSLENGLPVYLYRYKAGGPMHLGVMADEVERVRPEAVMTMPNGFDAVDYSMAVL